MKLYLSGPMTGIPDHNYPAFEAARTRLKAMGHEVICPAEAGEVEGWTWSDYLKRDLVLLFDAEAVVVLPGWEHSRGAQLEVSVATQLGMVVFTPEFEEV